MPSLKSYRVRIASVKSTQKITKAMQMVAAAKLKRAQEAAHAARPYADRIAAVVGNLSGGAKDDSAPLLLRGSGRDQVHLVVVATAERGLCGGFNTQIVRRARDYVQELTAAGKTVKILCVGKKGRDQLRRLFADKIVDFIDLSGYRTIDSTAAALIGGKVREMFEAGECDVATLVFSHFRSVIAQVPTVQQLIPIAAPSANFDELEGRSAAAESHTHDGELAALRDVVYTYEPSELAILDALLPRYVDSQIFRALLDNAAGFFGAQMTAMDNATRNAGDLIKKLTLQMNRTRQAMITRELIEIIAGADAV
jgi:F-type H+-transporting ATPase subunit gamma